MSLGIIAASHVPFAAAADYATEVLADSPLFYWRLGESSGSTAFDETANGYDGTYIGSPTLGASGAISDGDTAVTGFTSSNRVGISDAAWMDVLTGGISVEAWVKFTANLSAAQFVVARDKNTGAGDDERHWALRVGSSEQANFLLFNNSTSASVSGSTTGLNDDNWHHLVATYDGSNIRVYVDGSLDGGPTSFSGGLVNRAQPINVGSSSLGTAVFGGTIDEVAFYDSALSATRVLAHYNAA